MSCRAHELLEAARTSATELRAIGYEPARFRIHPRDIDVLTDHYLGLVVDEGLGGELLGLPLVADEMARRGEPVAEWLAPESEQT